MEITFFLTQKKEKYKNINICIFENNQKSHVQFCTPLQIISEDWDYDKQRPKNIYLKKGKRLNNTLDIIKVQLSSYILEKRKNNKILSEKAISKKIKELCFLQEIDYPKSSLLYFMDIYITSRREIICQSTYKRYMVFFNLIRRFEGFSMNRFSIEDINMNFINDFVLYGKNETYSENTIYRTISFIKTILNFVEKKNIKTCLSEIEIRKRLPQREMVTLSEFEIKQIINTMVPPNLQAAKDWLLISCYMGQRISDFMKFKKEQLIEINGRLCISFTQQKTKKEILLPLHPVVINILQKNKNNFPKALDIQLYNSQIKQIALIAQIKQQVKTNKRIKHRAENLFVEKWEAITSHIGRRSFATNFYGKVPTPLLMDATGHSTERMFLRYINPKDEKRAISLGDYFNKIHNEAD